MILFYEVQQVYHFYNCRKTVEKVEDGKKIYLKREDEFLYTGRRYQIPKVTAISGDDLVTIFCSQGKDVFKIKITEDGVKMMKNDGNTEDIPALPGDHIEIVEGVFRKSVGKKLPINFHNDTGNNNNCPWEKSMECKYLQSFPQISGIRVLEEN